MAGFNPFLIILGALIVVTLLLKLAMDFLFLNIELFDFEREVQQPSLFLSRRF